MSKSAGEGHYLSLDGTEKEIRDMVKRAVTDVGPQPEGQMSPGVANLFAILKELGEEDAWTSLTADYQAGALRYVELKGAVADAVWALASRIQARKAELSLDDVREILKKGAERARPLAQAKIAEVRKRIGLLEV